MENLYRGEMHIHLEGKRLPLRYTWDAIARMRHRWPEENYDLTKVEDLADMVSIGLHHLGGEWTAERVIQASPPLYPVIEAVQTAMWRGFHGPGKPFPQNPPKPVMATILKTLSGLVPQWASAKSSGA